MFVEDACNETDKAKVLNHLSKCKRCSHFVSAMVGMADDAAETGVNACNECGAVDTGNSAYCGECGAKFTGRFVLKCSHCPGEVRPESKFCPHCGEKLGQKIEVKDKQVKEFIGQLPEEMRSQEVAGKITGTIKVFEELIKKDYEKTTG